MPIANNSPTTNLKTKGGFIGRRVRTIEKRVKLTHGAAFVPLGDHLQARGEVIWAELLGSVNAVVTGNDGTNTANAVALVMYPTTATAPLTQPATATVSNPAATSGAHMLQLIATGATNFAHAKPRFSTSAPAQNVNTVPAMLVVQPAFTNSSRLYANGTSGYVFGSSTATSTNTAGEVIVRLYVEEYEASPAIQVP
jgi:hypothetical protein